MRTSLLILSLNCSLIALSSCSSKDDQFKSAINDKLHSSYLCLSINQDFVSPVFMDNKVFNKYLSENSLVLIDIIENGKIRPDPFNTNKYGGVSALVKVGLLKKTTVIEPAFSFTHKPIKNIHYSLNLYNLTDLGKQTVQYGNGRNFTNDHKSAFCYAYPQVNTILNYVENKKSDRDVVEVKYSFKYSTPAAWTNNADLREMFPEIERSIKLQDGKAVMALYKTNNGWQANL